MNKSYSFPLDDWYMFTNWFYSNERFTSNQSMTLLMSFRDYAPCCKLQSSIESKEKRGIDANQYSWKTMRDNDQWLCADKSTYVQYTSKNYQWIWQENQKKRFKVVDTKNTLNMNLSEMVILPFCFWNSY